MKQKQFNNDTLMEALVLLQSVTPTQGEKYPAHWWQSNEALKITNAMDTYLNTFKKNCKKCKTKKEVNILITNLHLYWPYIEGFWENKDRFGEKIREEFRIMFQKFTNYLNNLG